jgi:hypothetical protein
MSSGIQHLYSVNLKGTQDAIMLSLLSGMKYPVPLPDTYVGGGNIVRIHQELHFVPALFLRLSFTSPLQSPFSRYDWLPEPTF